MEMMRYVLLERKSDIDGSRSQIPRPGRSLHQAKPGRTAHIRRAFRLEGKRCFKHYGRSLRTTGVMMIFGNLVSRRIIPAGKHRPVGSDLGVFTWHPGTPAFFRLDLEFFRLRLLLLSMVRSAAEQGIRRLPAPHLRESPAHDRDIRRLLRVPGQVTGSGGTRHAASRIRTAEKQAPGNRPPPAPIRAA